MRGFSRKAHTKIQTDIIEIWMIINVNTPVQGGSWRMCATRGISSQLLPHPPKNNCGDMIRPPQLLQPYPPHTLCPPALSPAFLITTTMNKAGSILANERGGGWCGSTHPPAWPTPRFMELNGWAESLQLPAPPHTNKYDHTENQ